ncbi:MAG: deoxynucleoside kinase [Nanoarchaeota archaeon]|nr:deoxynucleoside kinase [Nanoarchaeota archaeon]
MEEINNLFFISGPHGSGKTTLLKTLQTYEEKILLPELYTRNIKFETTPLERLILKLCGRVIENFECLEIARNNPERIVIGNRCAYDQEVYARVYHRRGWIDEEELDLAWDLRRDSFLAAISNPKAIVLNPGYETVKKHLEKRWNEGKKKWHEDDEQYTLLTCKEYETLNGKDEVLYIDHEIDLNDRSEIDKISGWIYEHCGLERQLA